MYVFIPKFPVRTALIPSHKFCLNQYFLISVFKTFCNPLVVQEYAIEFPCIWFLVRYDRGQKRYLGWLVPTCQMSSFMALASTTALFRLWGLEPAAVLVAGWAAQESSMDCWDIQKCLEVSSDHMDRTVVMALVPKEEHLNKDQKLWSKQLT